MSDKVMKANELMMQLLTTNIYHIDTLVKSLKIIRNHIQLSNVSYKQNDYEEMKKINDELLDFINELIENEEN